MNRPRTQRARSIHTRISKIYCRHYANDTPSKGQVLSACVFSRRSIWWTSFTIDPENGAVSHPDRGLGFTRGFSSGATLIVHRGGLRRATKSSFISGPVRHSLFYFCTLYCSMWWNRLQQLGPTNATKTVKIDSDKCQKQRLIEHEHLLQMGYLNAINDTMSVDTFQEI